MDIAKLQKYNVGKGKKDLLSSLQRLDYKLLQEKVNILEVNALDNLVEDIIEEFEDALKLSKNDVFTQLFFKRLVENEESPVFSAYEIDVESFNVFVYDTGSFWTYYIPTELRVIIKKELGF